MTAISGSPRFQRRRETRQLCAPKSTAMRGSRFATSSIVVVCLERFPLRVPAAESIEEMPRSSLHPPELSGPSYNATVGRQETGWPQRSHWGQSVDASTYVSHRNRLTGSGDLHPTPPDRSESNIC